MNLSIIVPVFNEMASLSLLVDEITANLSKHAYSYEIIFIDDGSTDDSWLIIKKLSENQNIMVKTMKIVVQESITSEEAVKYYHNELLKINIKPDRELLKDLELTDPTLIL